MIETLDWPAFYDDLMIKAILFDFNGVIVDDERLQCQAYAAALADEGVSLSEDDYYSALGTDDRSFVRKAFERVSQPLSDQAMARIIERKSALHRELIQEEIPIFRGVVTFLKGLSHRYELGLVSMSARGEIDYVVSRAGLCGLFTVIVSAEDVHAHKPDPCCYLRALELLNDSRRGRSLPGLIARECLVIEDAPPGIEAGNRAGMKSLGVTNTVSEAALRSAGAGVVTADLADWSPDSIQHVFDTEWNSLNA